MLPPNTYEFISLAALLPEIIVSAGGCAVLLLGQAPSPRWQSWTPRVVLGTLIAAIAVMVFQARPDVLEVETGSGLAFGPLALFARNATLLLGVVITLVSWPQAQASERGEYWSMILFTLAGVMLTAAANDLLMLWLALELVSIPTYVLVALSRRNRLALEAGTKYFFLGAMAAAINAYGFALLYGLSGSASLANVMPAVLEALHQPGSLQYAIAAVGVVLSLSGLAFKIAAVPLHFYIADVYQGAASPVAGLLGFVPKFAGFVAIFKVLTLTGHWDSADPAIFWLLWILAVASMTIGNVLALMQTNVKRMLAYSGVAHSGYMLVGVLIGPQATQGLIGDGTAAVMFYMVIYGIANLGAFAILGLLRVRGEPCETMRDIAGLLRRHAGLALLMALAMVTLMGLPPTAGFWGKLNLFGGALAGVATGLTPVEFDTPLIILVVIALWNSALAAAYYLRVIAAVLLYDNDQPAVAEPNEPQHIGAMLCGFLLLVFTFYPSLLLDQGRAATMGLRDEGLYASEPPPEREEAEPPQAVGASVVVPFGEADDERAAKTVRTARAP